MEDLDLGSTIRGFVPGQKVFGRYKLGKILGRGGMGVVWRVRDEEMERDIAIKMLPEMVANDPSAIRDLKRETARSQQLGHPNILRIYDFVAGGGLGGISMELIDGATLASLRHEQPGEVFSVEKLTPLVRQLCAALTYAHDDARVVHRDLKPANLMVDSSGRLKVMDFGIAASLSESVSRVSNRAATSGSPVYMSPQQWRGVDPTASDDLYAVGATLYELLAGQPPFKSPQPAALMHQVLNEPPLPLNERRAKAGLPPVPAVWEKTVMALLAKEPQDRPQSAAEVAERLGLASAGPSTQRPSPAGVERLDPKTISAAQANALGSARSTSKTPLYAAMAAGVLLLAGLGWYFGSYAPEQERLALEQARQKEATRLAEERRIADEQSKAVEAAKLAEQKRLTESQARRERENKAKQDPEDRVAAQQKESEATVENTAGRQSEQLLPRVYSVGDLDQKFSVLQRVEPLYPAAMQRADIEGQVLLDFTINANGELENVQTRSSTNDAFDQAARTALQKWKFRPGIKNGAAVGVRTMQTFTFKLN
ncbi:MAG: TonB family protein [Lacunisphaera sp.]|nr:TonB family protein [Lacunisphaera sp.]